MSAQQKEVVLRLIAYSLDSLETGTPTPLPDDLREELSNWPPEAVTYSLQVAEKYAQALLSGTDPDETLASLKDAWDQASE